MTQTTGATFSPLLLEILEELRAAGTPPPALERFAARVETSGHKERVATELVVVIGRLLDANQVEHARALVDLLVVALGGLEAARRALSQTTDPRASELLESAEAGKAHLEKSIPPPRTGVGLRKR